METNSPIKTERPNWVRIVGILFLLFAVSVTVYALWPTTTCRYDGTVCTKKPWPCLCNG